LNEEKTIYEVVSRALSLDRDLKVVVIDDGSTDRTADMARKAGAEVIKFEENRGQWEALKAGFDFALRKGYDIVVTMDADGQHDPADIPALIKPIERWEADLVIGSRLRDGRGRRVMLPYRYVGIKVFSWLLSSLMGRKLTDVMSGYRAYRSDLLRSLIRRLNERQYGVLEATLLAWKLGARICEIPVKPRARRASKKGSLRFLFNLCRVLLKTLASIALVR